MAYLEKRVNGWRAQIRRKGEQAAYDFSLNTYPLPEDCHAELTKYKVKAIRKASRDAYGTPLAEVEALLDVQNKSNKINTPPESSDSRKAETLSNGKDKKGELDKTNNKSSGGKGGEQHKEIQQQIKQAAYEKGFAATIEYHIGEGRHIDLLINTGAGKIACEISVSTTAKHEVQNIRKCLDAGFKDVCMICDDGKKLEEIKKLTKEVVSPEHFMRLLFLYPEEVVKVLEGFELSSNIKMVRGFQVERQWKKIDDAERKRRELVFSKIVSNADQGS